MKIEFQGWTKKTDRKCGNLWAVFLAVAILTVSLFPCHLQAADEKLEPEVTVILDESIAGNETLSAAWMGYSMARVAWIRNQFRAGHLDPAAYENSFSEELAGRRTLAYIWHEIQKNETGGNAYLDALTQVQAAGFMPEYVWYYLNPKKWTDRPANLRLEDFTAWNQAHLPEHRPETQAKIQIVKPT